MRRRSNATNGAIISAGCAPHPLKRYLQIPERRITRTLRNGKIRRAAFFRYLHPLYLLHPFSPCSRSKHTHVHRKNSPARGHAKHAGEKRQFSSSFLDSLFSSSPPPSLFFFRSSRVSCASSSSTFSPHTFTLFVSFNPTILSLSFSRCLSLPPSYFTHFFCFFRK